MVDEGTAIRLTVARRIPRLPSVIGTKLRRAENTLGGLGYRVRVKREVSSQPPGTVLSQTPGAGTRLMPGERVTLTVAKAPPPVATVDCQGYSPCIPPGPDVDCAGGSGNGPRYEGQGDVPWGPFRVTGSDPYGLDGDNDGWGCES